MSRLIESDIEEIGTGLDALDRSSRNLTGTDIEGIARAAAGYDGENEHLRTAVVPITAGLGIIEDFSDTCAAILSHCGADAFVTEATDVAGLQEAYRRDAELIFTADDDVCTLVAVGAPAYSDNGYATGRAFAVALERMAVGDEVLVLGAGPVGTSALGYLMEKGFKAAVFDLDADKAAHAARSKGAYRELEPFCYRRYRNILDATCSGGFLTSDDVSPDTNLSAPGMPLCVTEEAAGIVHLFHNPLELGVTTMYFDCMRQLRESGGNSGTTSRMPGMPAGADQMAKSLDEAGRLEEPAVHRHVPQTV